MPQKKKQISVKRKPSVKRIYRKVVSTVLIIISVAALFFFVNDKFLKIEWIPSSNDVVIFFGGGIKPLVKPKENEAVVHFIDVGQADSELIVTNNYTVLIDGGLEDTSGNIFGYLNFQEIEKIDLLICTHPHGDHIGSIYKVLMEYNVDKIVMPRIPVDLVPDTVSYLKMMAEIDMKNIDAEYAEVGEKYFIDDDSYIEILAPTVDYYDDLNDFSVVTKFVDGENSFLFTGDLTSIGEKDLIESGADIDADVLKVGHHGSAGSSSEEFLLKVTPDIAVFEVAEINYYGHPRSEVFDRLENAGCYEFYATSRDGNIVMVSDGSELRVETEKNFLGNVA